MKFTLSRRNALGYSGVTIVAGLTGMGGFRSISAHAQATPVTADWDAFNEEVAAVAPLTTILAAEFVGDDIVPIYASNADAVFPVGSSFKFWILGALAAQVDAGTLAWEQPVEIEERYISVPSGDLRYSKPGTVYTMRYLAERMIQKSDNTATDHLLFLAGRENVEQMMEIMGVSDLTPNIPLISTRELAMMKFAYSTEDLDAYYAAPIEERRRILDEVIDAIPYSALADLEQDAPIELDRVEWFASREDLARTVQWLNATSANPALRPVRETLALETPVPFDGEVWPYVGYKGGSEFGLLTTTWLLDRADGRTFFYSVAFK
ncbi:MAG: serine hydrolase, partial [Thermomicrobiales bacterium]